MEHGLEPANFCSEVLSCYLVVLPLHLVVAFVCVHEDLWKGVEPLQVSQPLHLLLLLPEHVLHAVLVGQHALELLLHQILDCTATAQLAQQALCVQ